jgi:hypothetical protein
MFKWNPPKRGAVEVARPYVIRAEVRGDVVEIRVRLFGMAGFHGPMVMQGLLTALETGVSIRNHGSRAKFIATEARIERFDGLAREWLQDGSSATLQLVTPIIIRRHQDLRISPLSLFRSALRRAQAVAPWMHCDLTFDEALLLATARRLRCSMADVHAETWSRTSRNNPGHAIPMNGYGGTVTIAGALGTWATYLDLAQFASLGGECALGFGAIRASIYP